MTRTPDQTYVGLADDFFGGMTPTGTVVRDAQVFGLIPETETCKGWSFQRMEALHDKVFVAWQPYGNLVSHLPPDLRERHERIFGSAFERARALGWSPELGDDD